MRFKYLAGLAAAIVLSVGQAGATSIPVANNSFENPTLSPGGFTSSACPSGWDCSGSQGFLGGVYFPTSAQFTPGTDGIAGKVPDGNNAAYVYGLAPVQLAQYSGLGTIAANTTYTLSLWAGARADQGPDAWAQGFTASIQLLAKLNIVASLAVLDPGLGNWESVALSWDSSSSPTDVGENLAIRLVWTSSGASTNTQVAWDDVTLNSTADTATDPGATPIPGAVWLFGSTLAGSAGVARWRRKRKAIQSAPASIRST
jgi:hypothetical protein